MTVPLQVPGPTASVLEAISGEAGPVPAPSHSWLTGRALFAAGPSMPFLPSLITEIVTMPQSAYLDADVMIAGNLTVNGNQTVTGGVSVVAKGADPLGGADSTAAFIAAADAVPAGGGCVDMPPGTYKVACGNIVVARPGVYFRAFGGPGSVVINATGSGDLIRMYSTQQYTSGWGGGVIGQPIIDGASAGAGSCGIHAGDIYQLRWDVAVRKFQGTGSKNIWLDNQFFWAEDMCGRIWAQQGTSNVVFDNSANVSGSSTGSFARTLLDIVLDMKGVGDGVILQGGANIYNSKIGIYGNCDYGAAQHYVLSLLGMAGLSFTATNASPCVFTAAGSFFSNGTFVTLSGGSLPTGFSAQGYYVVNASGATFELAATAGGSPINSSSTGTGTVQGPYSRINTSRLDIGVECNATTGTQPITINFGTAGSNSIRDCTGIIDFTGSNPFAGAVNWDGGFQFDGVCTGDANLKRVTGSGTAHYSNGAIGNNAFITTRYASIATAAPSGNVTGAILGTGDPGQGGTNWADQTFTLVNQGTGSITFAAVGTSHVATGTSCVIPAGSALTFVWIANSSVWYPAA